MAQHNTSFTTQRRIIILFTTIRPKRDVITREWRKLHNEELHDLYTSPTIKVEGVHPVVYDEYIDIYYRQNTTIKLSNDYH
jgi:hypothetical protein